MKSAEQMSDGTYEVAGHERVEKRELGYKSSACSCGWSSFPCPDWHEAVDALVESQVTAVVVDGTAVAYSRRVDLS